MTGEQVPYAHQMAAFYFIELVYQVAWSRVLAHGRSPYHEFAERWGNAAFGTYVDMLKQLADRATGAAPDAAIVAIAKEVLDLEVDFWNMALFDRDSARGSRGVIEVVRSRVASHGGGL
jgi:formylaminopyrimidine deformylase / aminopyrimidine aminohydrolase